MGMIEECLIATVMVMWLGDILKKAQVFWTDFLNGLNKSNVNKTVFIAGFLMKINAEFAVLFLTPDLPCLFEGWEYFSSLPFSPVFWKSLFKASKANSSSIPKPSSFNW